MNFYCTVIAGLGEAEASESSGLGWAEAGGGAEAWEACASGGGGAWWWGCNVCWCAGGGAARCTALWCGGADCAVPAAPPCRADEVCVPGAGALCLRAPCRATGECRRAAGRRVEAGAVPAPPACWSRTLPAPSGCARARLELQRERLGRGAHVDTACASLRRALALALLPRAPPLVLLCDLPPDDADALDLTIVSIHLFFLSI